MLLRPPSTCIQFRSADRFQFLLIKNFLYSSDFKQIGLCPPNGDRFLSLLSSIGITDSPLSIFGAPYLFLFPCAAISAALLERLMSVIIRTWLACTLVDVGGAAPETVGKRAKRGTYSKSTDFLSNED